MAGKEIVTWTANETEFAITATGDQATEPAGEVERAELRQQIVLVCFVFSGRCRRR